MVELKFLSVNFLRFLFWLRMKDLDIQIMFQKGKFIQEAKAKKGVRLPRIVSLSFIETIVSELKAHP